MSLGNLLLVILVAATLFSNGVQAYIHYEAYPLFANVGKSEFAAYIGEYEKRLAIPLLAPYGITILANLILIFVRPANVSVIGVIIALLLNLSVAIVTMRVATPVYEKMKASGTAIGADMKQLMSINLIRLVLSSIASLVVLGLLLGQLP